MANKKTRKSTQRRSAPRRTSRPQTVAEYIARVPAPARAALNTLRATVRSAMPADVTEVISYGIPAFKRQRVLVWYAAFSNHVSLFPTAAVIDAFKDELEVYATSKGTIKFPLDKPLPTALIKKTVQARVLADQGRSR